MKMIRAYGVSRSRDKKGRVVNSQLKPYTMCIHTMVGSGWKTMMVLVAEEYEEDAVCDECEDH